MVTIYEVKYFGHLSLHLIQRLSIKASLCLCFTWVSGNIIYILLACPLTCQNGGTLNETTCTCDCADGYSGDTCRGEWIAWWYSGSKQLTSHERSTHFMSHITYHSMPLATEPSCKSVTNSLPLAVFCILCFTLGIHSKTDLLNQISNFEDCTAGILYPVTGGVSQKILQHPACMCSVQCRNPHFKA